MTSDEHSGARNIESKANTFEEMAELSKMLGIKMFQEDHLAHLKAMNGILSRG